MYAMIVQLVQRLDDKRGSVSSLGKVKSFFFFVSSRPVLEPTQPSFQWASGALSTR
jgi:hypothetical protein